MQQSAPTHQLVDPLEHGLELMRPKAENYLWRRRWAIKSESCERQLVLLRDQEAVLEELQSGPEHGICQVRCTAVDDHIPEDQLKEAGLCTGSVHSREHLAQSKPAAYK